MWGKLRPAEWGFSLYFGYALLRIVIHIARTRSFDGIHLAHMPWQFIPLVIVVFAVKLGQEYFALPWGDVDPVRRRDHVRMAPLFVVAGLVGSLLGWPRTAFTETGFARAVMVALHVWLWVGGAAGATALLWFAMGIRQKSGEPLIVVLGRRLSSGFRDWFPLIGLLYAYGLGRVVGPIFRDFDVELAAIDRFLFGGANPSLLAERLIRPWLSEWLSGCYVFYALVYPIVLGAVWVKGGRAFRETGAALCGTLAIGYIGYNLVPAQGPLFTQHFDVSLELYYTGFVKEQLMDVTRVPRDCFPSLHTGASLVLLIGAWRHMRTLGVLLAPFVLSIPVACVYLRYHYVIDVIAGIALATAAWIVARHLERSSKTEA